MIILFNTISLNPQKNNTSNIDRHKFIHFLNSPEYFLLVF